MKRTQLTHSPAFIANHRIRKLHFPTAQPQRRDRSTTASHKWSFQHHRTRRGMIENNKIRRPPPIDGLTQPCCQHRVGAVNPAGSPAPATSSPASGQQLIVSFYFSSIMTEPLVTPSPAETAKSVTTPDLWAFTGFSIFMASKTTTTSPSATSWPSSTFTLITVPCIGAATASPETPALEPPERRFFAFFLAPPAPPFGSG